MTAESVTGGALEQAQEAAGRPAENVERVVLGKPDEVRLVVAAFAAGGHVLLEDVPGTAKTVLARSLAASIEGAEITRIQGTPDLQPTDATGLAVFDPASREFAFRPGPLFAHVVLVDEINRAMPRTQSALLEAMAEGQVTADGESRPLPDPFLMLATENPLEHEGTFPLPEAQLDRFFLKVTLGYPALDDEVRIVQAQLYAHPLGNVRPVIDVGALHRIQAAVSGVYLDPILQRWLIELVRATRELDVVTVGASVRASLALERAARAWALLHGRPFVAPEDVLELFEPVVQHRTLLSPFRLEAGANGDEPAELALLERCLERAPRPGIGIRAHERDLM